MRVKIWGARGSTPTPIGPNEVKEKIVSALLKIAEIEDETVRETLIGAILAKDEPQESQAVSMGVDTPAQERRNIIESYLDTLSPLAGKTASGNTPCIQIESDRETFIIDAGSGIRALGNELMKEDFGRGEGTLHLFFSHPHWDHIQGFPFFRPAYVPGNKIYIYGVHDMEMALRRQQEFVSFPVQLSRMHANIEFVQLDPERQLEFDELTVHCIRNHHPGDSYAFRFEKGNKVFVYASDASYPTGINQDQYIEFFNGANLLIFDSQFTQRESDEKEDWGHSSSFVGVEMAQKAGVEQLVLYHYDPSYTDEELEGILDDTLKFQKNQYPRAKQIDVTIAVEGQTFDLDPLPTTQLKQIPGGKVAILKPAGIFDENIAAELMEQLNRLPENQWPPQLVIDLSAVELLEVAGLKALVRLRKEQQSTTMVLAGPSINVQQLIDLAGYSDFFAIYPSVHIALNELKAHETLNLPGQTIKRRYHVEAKVGDGRLGTVFKATDTRHNRTVALKVLSASFSEGAIEQFLNQARQIINLSHPSIVHIHDCDEDRGLSFMVEEFIEGQTLRDLVDAYQGRPLPLADALSIAERVAYGLEYAHTHSVVHGDLKPKNVLLFEDEVKISDFGLGRLESGKSLLNIDVPLAMVSARYVAPEQILGHPIDARTDLYALGAMLYELFTGQPVFEGTDDEVLRHHRSTPPRPPRDLNPTLSHALEHLILKLLDKDPNKRYAKARQVRRILGSMLTFAQSKLPRQRWPAYVEEQDGLQQLADLWAETQQGRGHLVFITGEAGVGKTRLAQEFAQTTGPATLLLGKGGCCHNGTAYHPFLDALNTYFSNVPAEEAHQQVGPILRELSSFIPEFRENLPTALLSILDKIPKTRKKSGEYDIAARNLQYPSLSLLDLIKEAAQEKPWLIIVDDLHEADLSSIHLLHYLGRYAGELPLMIIGIYRPTALGENEALQEVVETLSLTTPYNRLTLQNLSDKGIKQLLENLWLQPVPDGLVTAIARRTKGNPFYAEEVAKGLVDDGVVSWRDNKWHFAPVVEVGLPKDVQEAIMRRINRLSKQTQTLLHQAAILGRTFQFDTLHEMSDQSRWDALESLDIALERQLLKEIPGEGVLRFKHTEIQQVLYHDLSQLKRQLMHREAGDALERQYIIQTRPDRATEALAYHFYEAGEFKKAMAYSSQAAACAEAVYAPQAAIAWYTLALDALDQLGNDKALETARFESLLARERLYNLWGERQAQIADLDTLQKMVQRTDEPVKQAAVHNRRAIYERLTNQLADALTEAQAGLIAARQANHLDLEADSLLQIATIEANRGNFDLALEQAQLAQKIIHHLDDHPQEAALNDLLGVIHVGLGEYQQAEAYYQEALFLYRPLGRWDGQAETLSHLSDLYFIRGDYLRAESFCRQALEINRLASHRRGEASCLHRLALIHKDLGSYQAAQQYLDVALPLRYTVEDHQGEAEGELETGAIARLTDDHDTAKRKLEKALDIFQRLELRAQEATVWLELGFLFEAMAALPQAKHAYQRAFSLRQALKNLPGEMEARGGLAHCLLLENKPAEARTTLAAAVEWLDTQDVWGLRDPVRLYMTIYRVFRANKAMAVAQQALETAQRLTQQRANRIDDLATQSETGEGEQAALSLS